MAEYILRPFWSYRQMFSNSGIAWQIIKNICLFIPLGSILYRIYPRKVILIIPIALSCFVEMIQLLAGTGLCELDDIISNGLGGFVGFYVAKLTIRAINKKKELL